MAGVAAKSVLRERQVNADGIAIDSAGELSKVLIEFLRLRAANGCVERRDYAKKRGLAAERIAQVDGEKATIGGETMDGEIRC